MHDLEEKVRELIDTSEFSIADYIDEDDEYYWSFGVRTADDARFVVYSRFSDGPVVISSRLKIKPGLLLRYMDGEDKKESRVKEEKRVFQNLLLSVLTNTPGRFLYLNASGETCDFNEMEEIQFRHRIYEDGLSQHTLLNGIIDQLSAIESISEIMEQYESMLNDEA